ncbi:MAG: hypothetical protein PVF87_11105 [Acidimicrobiia bacterium]
MSSVLQFTRGVAAAGVIGASTLAFALLVGVLPGTSIFVFPLAALAGGALFSIPDRERTLQVAGALLVGLGALGLGIVSGFGALEICGLIGAVLATAIVGGVVPVPRIVSTGVLALLALGLVVVNLIPLVLDGGGLGHDESAYALKAQHWLEGTPETGWSLHRGIAMSGYGYLVLGAGGAEGGLRLLGLGSLLGLAVAAWMLGSGIGGRMVGPLAAIAVVSSPALLRRSTEFLSDVPASALLVACMVVVWVEFAERDRPSYRLLWMLPFAWAAFYLRYQSALSFALIAVAVAVLFREKARAAWKPIVATGLVGLAGLVPHFVFATSETGSPLGILLYTADVAGREFFGEGLRDYFLLMGWPLAAFIGPIAVGFFLWWLVKARSIAAERTSNLFLMIPAAGQVVILGVVSHGEARFIFFPLTLTLIGGIIGLFYVSQTWNRTVSGAVRIGLAVLLAGSLALSAAYVRRAVESRIVGTEPIELAGEEMRELSGDSGCSVMTSYLPQITYYSTCYTAPFRTQLEPEEALEFLPGEERFLLLVEDGKRQPTGPDLEDLLALTDRNPIVVSGERESADIYLFTDE